MSTPPVREPGNLGGWAADETLMRPGRPSRNYGPTQNGLPKMGYSGWVAPSLRNLARSNNGNRLAFISARIEIGLGNKKWIATPAISNGSSRP
jgi:hypothetical protein